ncbi:uncharacterized protein LOC120895448 [Anopheles arabiensis]|nr:uncharacterized protein LOC120895448 [Anopheles arabiensis]XP_040219699.1 uncharacterized protein LOC120947930 [Anopheles coluzzii]XP_041763750.1 uncharacterized protein LOC121589144 [Anopheles merus]XP_041763751.1 uncharacterized protein LOC121589144 [Anopheles merus]
MRSFTVVAVLALSFCYVQAADEAPATKDAAAAAAPAEGGKTYKRLIPADVLRDFPGMCFASTKCATFEPGQYWDLTPFCGRSTCVLSDDAQPRLLELVEDCGPLPLANDKCKLDTEKTNKTAPFPACCPTFTCEPGAKLEYPEIKTAPESTSEQSAKN